MIRVGILRGGISGDYDASLQNGAAILAIIREKFPSDYKAVDILVTKDGSWHIGGMPASGDKLRESVDVIWNALSGEYAHDGQAAALLEGMGIPFTGSGSLSHALASDTELARSHFESLSVKTPETYVIADYRSKHDILPEVYFKEAAQEVFLKFSPPWIVYPSGVWSRAGLSIAADRDQLLEAIRTASHYPGDIVIEEFISGKGAHMLLADNFRNQRLYASLPIEADPYTGTTPRYSANSFTETQKKSMNEIAKKAYEHFNIRHYGHMDFIVTPRHVYLRGVNTLPSFLNDSPASHALQSVGAAMPDFVDHIIKLALANKS